MLKDYYAILGVGRDASMEEIREAYHRWARRLHPDQAGPGIDAERFQLVHEAYEVLSDPERRAAHDRERQQHAGRGGGRPERVRRRRSRGARPILLRWLRLGFVAAPYVLVMLFAAWAWVESAKVGRLEKRISEVWRERAAVLARQASIRADIDEALSGPGIHTYFTADVAFPPGAAELTHAASASFLQAVRQLETEIHRVPSSKGWAIVLETRASRAVGPGGELPEAWHRAAARFQYLAERLIAEGMPEDQIAFRFAAGPERLLSSSLANVVRMRLICCRPAFSAQP